VDEIESAISIVANVAADRFPHMHRDLYDSGFSLEVMPSLDCRHDDVASASAPSVMGHCSWWRLRQQ